MKNLIYATDSNWERSFRTGAALVALTEFSPGKSAHEKGLGPCGGNLNNNRSGNEPFDFCRGLLADGREASNDNRSFWGEFQVDARVKI